MITRQRLSRGYERPADAEAVAAASAIGRTLSMNGRGVGENHFSSRSGSFLGDSRRTISMTGAKHNSRTPSMTRTRSIVRSESIQGSTRHTGRNSMRKSSFMRPDGQIYEDAQSAFDEFGGPQAKGVIHRSPSIQSKPRTVKKYVPSYKGLIAVEVPVEEVAPRPPQRTRTMTRPTSSRNGSMTRSSSQGNLPIPRSQSRNSSLTTGHNSSFQSGRTASFTSSRTASFAGNRTSSLTGERTSSLTNSKPGMHSQPKRYMSLTNASLANIPRKEQFMSTTLEEEEEEETKPLMIKKEGKPIHVTRIVRREQPSNPSSVKTVKTVKTIRRTPSAVSTPATAKKAVSARSDLSRRPAPAPERTRKLGKPAGVSTKPLSAAEEAPSSTRIPGTAPNAYSTRTQAERTTSSSVKPEKELSTVPTLVAAETPTLSPPMTPPSLLSDLLDESKPQASPFFQAELEKSPIQQSGREPEEEPEEDSEEELEEKLEEESEVGQGQEPGMGETQKDEEYQGQEFESLEDQIWNNKLEEEIKQSLENETPHQTLAQHIPQEETIEEEPEKEEEQEKEEENEKEKDEENPEPDESQILPEMLTSEQTEEVPLPAIKVDGQVSENQSPIREASQARLRNYLKDADSYIEKSGSEAGSINGDQNLNDHMPPLKMSSRDSQETELSGANISSNSGQEDRLAREVRRKLDDMGQNSSNSDENSDDLFVDSREDILDEVEPHRNNHYNPYLPNQSGVYPSRGLLKQSSPIKSALKKTTTSASNTSSVYSDASPANQAYLSLTTAENTRLNAQLTSNDSIPRKSSYKHLNRSRSLRNNNNGNHSLSPPPRDAARAKRHSHHVGIRAPVGQQPGKKPTAMRGSPATSTGNHPSRNDHMVVPAKSQGNNPHLYPREPPPRRSSFEKSRNKDNSIGMAKLSLRNGSSVESNYQQSTLDSHFRAAATSPPDAPSASGANENVPNNGAGISAGFKSRFQDSDSEEEGAPFSSGGSKSTQPSSASTVDSANSGNGFSLFKHKEEMDGVNKKWGLSLRSSSAGDPANQQGYSNAKRFGSAAYENQGYDNRMRSLREEIPKEEDLDEAGAKKNVFGKKLKKLFGRYK